MISLFSRTHNPINALLTPELLLFPFRFNFFLVPTAFHPLLHKQFYMKVRFGIPWKQCHFCSKAHSAYAIQSALVEK